jgi:antitoxin ParD1/3/4
MSRTITFQPSEKMSSFIDDLLDTGTFSTQSEVVRAGIRLLQEQSAASKLEQLRALIDEAENSPIMESWGVNDFLAKVKKYNDTVKN